MPTFVTIVYTPFLECLWLYHMEVLEYISDSDISEEVQASSTMMLTPPFFPSLKLLFFQSCPNLKGWWRRMRRDLVATTFISTLDHQQHQHHQLLSSFPRLCSSLRITNCPNNLHAFVSVSRRRAISNKS